MKRHKTHKVWEGKVKQSLLKDDMILSIKNHNTLTKLLLKQITEFQAMHLI